MASTPKTQYTKSGDLHIAYQVTGSGPLDLVFVPGCVSHLEYQWEHPWSARFFERLGSFSRLIRFDKRGTGLSDRVGGIPTLEQRMDDVRAVMDAVGSQRAALFGGSEGGPMSLLFAATYPMRISALVLYGSYARRSWAPDHPWGHTEEEWQAMIDTIEGGWGERADLEVRAPSARGDESYQQWWATYQRLAASPGAPVAVMQMNKEIDVRPVLSAIRVPTLVVHRTGDRVVRTEQGRYLAEHVPGARLVELVGVDHAPWVGNMDAILDEVEEFLTGARHDPETDRVLATVLFTDIVGSTERAASLGDRKWRDLLEGYYALARRELARFRGREVDTAGDGFFASFDGPARGIRCAAAIAAGVRPLGIEVRAGLHTGECEVIGEKVGGIAVHIGARVAGLAKPGEVLVSNTVKDLVAGSGIRFEERGAHILKGRPRRVAAFRGRACRLIARLFAPVLAPRFVRLRFTRLQVLGRWPLVRRRTDTGPCGTAVIHVVRLYGGHGRSWIEERGPAHTESSRSGNRLRRRNGSDGWLRDPPHGAGRPARRGRAQTGYRRSRGWTCRYRA